MKRKLLALFFIVILTLSALTGCSGSAESNGEKVLRVACATYYVNESLDIADNSTYNYFGISTMGIGECLFKLDENLEPQYWLATDLVQEDDYTWTVTLREDVYFHNGNPMTAESVKRCLERTLRDFDLAAYSLSLEEITIVDDHTLTLRTTDPTPGLMSILCDTMFMIYDYEDGCDFATDSSYTGPFMVESTEPDVQKTLVRFDDYWNGASPLDKVIYVACDDSTAALEAGDVDLAQNVNMADLESLQDSGDFTLTSALVPRGEMIWFNEHSENTQDLAVRTAIAKCFDRETIAKTIYHDLAVPAYGVFPDFLSFGGTEQLDLAVDSYDPEGAAELLADAGYTDSDGDGVLDKDGVELSFHMVCYTDDCLLAVADLLSAELDKLGIELKITSTYDYTSYEAEDNFDIMMITYGMAMIGNPYYWIDTMVASYASANSGHYANDRVDALAAQMRQAADTEQRDEICFQIQQEMLDDCHWVVFAHKSIYYVYSNKVKNFQASPCQYYTIDNQIDIEV